MSSGHLFSMMSAESGNKIYDIEFYRWLIEDRSQSLRIPDMNNFIKNNILMYLRNISKLFDNELFWPCMLLFLYKNAELLQIPTTEERIFFSKEIVWVNPENEESMTMKGFIDRLYSQFLTRI